MGRCLLSNAMRSTSIPSPLATATNTLLPSSSIESTASQSPGDSKVGRAAGDQGDYGLGALGRNVQQQASTAFPGVFATPDPHRVCCFVAGLAYVVNVKDPGAGAELATHVPSATQHEIGSFLG